MDAGAVELLLLPRTAQGMRAEEELQLIHSAIRLNAISDH